MPETPNTLPDAVTDRTPLTVTVADHVAILEMRGTPNNFFDEALIKAIADAAHLLDEDPHCRALVLCSAGKHFCAGADFGSDSTFGDDRAAGASRIYRQALRMFETRKPMIAAVQGAAVGGGLGLACAADFRVADPSTRFVANFSLLGIHQGFGASVTLPAIVGAQKAADLLLRGASVKGEEAARIGLADRLSPAGEQRETAVAWAREIAAAAPLAVESIRATLRSGLADRVRSALERELAEQARLWGTDDATEGLAAVTERRPALFRAQ